MVKMREGGPGGVRRGLRRFAASALFLLFGLGILVGAAVAGHPVEGAWAAVISVVLAVVFAIGGQVGLIRDVRGDGDERSAHIANVTNGVVLNALAVIAVIGAATEISHGTQGPWTVGCVLGGIVYAVVFLVVRAVS